MQNSMHQVIFREKVWCPPNHFELLRPWLCHKLFGSKNRFNARRSFFLSSPNFGVKSHPNFGWKPFLYFGLHLISGYKTIPILGADQECGSSQIFNAFASRSSWSFMLPSSIPLPHFWNFLLSFQLGIELVASEFASASGLFHQSASASTKI